MIIVYIYGKMCGTDTDTSDQYSEHLVYNEELVQYTLIEHSESTKYVQ